MDTTTYGYAVKVRGKLSHATEDALEAYASVEHLLAEHHYPATVQLGKWLDWLYGALDNGDDLLPLTCYGVVSIEVACLADASIRR